MIESLLSISCFELSPIYPDFYVEAKSVFIQLLCHMNCGTLLFWETEEDGGRTCVNHSIIYCWVFLL